MGLSEIIWDSMRLVSITLFLFQGTYAASFESLQTLFFLGESYSAENKM